MARPLIWLTSGATGYARAVRAHLKDVSPTTGLVVTSLILWLGVAYSVVAWIAVGSSISFLLFVLPLAVVISLVVTVAARMEGLLEDDGWTPTNGQALVVGVATLLAGIGAIVVWAIRRT